MRRIVYYIIVLLILLMVAFLGLTTSKVASIQVDRCIELEKMLNIEKKPIDR